MGWHLDYTPIGQQLHNDDQLKVVIRWLPNLTLDTMNLKVSLATREDKPLLQRLMELYQYDSSEVEDKDLDQHGCFGYSYLDHYWIEEGRYPFLVRVEDKLAGFVLVNRHTFLPGNDRAVAEFFVMRKYRRQGVGQRAAFHVFDTLPGKWEIQETANNLDAQRFWRRVIANYTAGKYSEVLLDDERWQGPVQSFDNTAR
jgi:predicted acetyltransferase